MATLVAPAPYAVFVTRGQRYTADASSVITATAQTDIQDLLSAGCALINVVPLPTFSSLPTTLPATSGVLWNNGGIICVS
jgi:hypothetical protein